jgi:hypothetical protein
LQLGDWDYVGQRVLTSTEETVLPKLRLIWQRWFNEYQEELGGGTPGQTVSPSDPTKLREPDWEYGHAWEWGTGKLTPGYGGEFDIGGLLDEVHYIPNTLVDGAKVTAGDSYNADLEADGAKTIDPQTGDENVMGDSTRIATHIVLLSFEQPDGPGSRTINVRLTIWAKDPGLSLPYTYSLTETLSLRN